MEMQKQDASFITALQAGEVPQTLEECKQHSLICTSIMAKAWYYKGALLRKIKIELSAQGYGTWGAYLTNEEGISRTQGDTLIACAELSDAMDPLSPARVKVDDDQAKQHEGNPLAVLDYASIKPLTKFKKNPQQLLPLFHDGGALENISSMTSREVEKAVRDNISDGETISKQLRETEGANVQLSVELSNLKSGELSEFTRDVNVEVAAHHEIITRHVNHVRDMLVRIHAGQAYKLATDSDKAIIDGAFRTSIIGAQATLAETINFINAEIPCMAIAQPLQADEIAAARTEADAWNGKISVQGSKLWK